MRILKNGVNSEESESWRGRGSITTAVRTRKQQLKRTRLWLMGFLEERIEDRRTARKLREGPAARGTAKLLLKGSWAL